VPGGQFKWGTCLYQIKIQKVGLVKPRCSREFKFLETKIRGCCRNTTGISYIGEYLLKETIPREVVIDPVETVR